jgi:hypothetical protein
MNKNQISPKPVEKVSSNTKEEMSTIVKKIVELIKVKHT